MAIRPSAVAAAVLAALVVPAVAGARELRAPRAEEAFFGFVQASVPPGATTAVLVVGPRRVASAHVSGPRVVFRLQRRAGRCDVRVRFEGEGRLVRRDETLGAWLLPRTAHQARRERSLDGAMRRRIAVLGRGFPGWAGIWVHDLNTGHTAGWNSDASFPAASTVKLGVLLAALRRFGPRPERSAAWPEIRDLAVWSSNLASNRLLILLGGSESGGTRIVQEALHRVGARESTFTGNYRLGTAVLSDAPRPLPLQTYRRTTAHDLGRILFELHAASLGNGLALRRTGLSRHEARVGLALLLSSSPRGANLGLLRPSFGFRMPLAQKQGWTTSVRHTAAIVYGPSGPRIVVVLTYRPHIDDWSARELGRRLVVLVRRWQPR